MYINGEYFGFTPEEIRTILGNQDLEPSRTGKRVVRHWNPRKAARNLRKAARYLFAIAGTAFVAIVMGKILVMWWTTSPW